MAMGGTLACGKPAVVPDAPPPEPYRYQCNPLPKGSFGCAPLADPKSDGVYPLGCVACRGFYIWTCDRLYDPLTNTPMTPPEWHQHGPWFNCPDLSNLSLSRHDPRLQN